MITEKKMREIRETFDKSERLIEQGKLSTQDLAYIMPTHDALAWVLGEYTQNPLEDY
jgi:hypothetical protein